MIRGHEMFLRRDPIMQFKIKPFSDERNRDAGQRQLPLRIGEFRMQASLLGLPLLSLQPLPQSNRRRACRQHLRAAGAVRMVGRRIPRQPLQGARREVLHGLLLHALRFARAAPDP
ncbi:hypothetical protein D3C83_54750 [compost metagenome]